jgi:DNA polymerase III gamma/tau subunit
VLGLVGRDLLFAIIDAVVDEDAPRAFELADRAVESGHDLRLVCRELSRVVRDIMIISVDPSRAGDGELAEGELERLTQLGGRFSREDLMRAFDLLAKAELDIRTASHPRYHFEMVLLRWMHLRKLVPLTDLMELLGGGKAVAAPRTSAPTRSASAPTSKPIAPTRSAIAPTKTDLAPTDGATTPSFKDSFLAEVRAGKQFFYNTVVAQAQRIDVASDRITFTFLPTHRALKEQFEQTRPWLESAAERLSGRKFSIVAVQADAPPAATPAAAAPSPAPEPPAKRDLTAEAKASPAVQAMLEVFPAEIRDVEEM